MKIWLGSDLHREFPDNKDIRVDANDADVAILAGDIGLGFAGIEWAAESFDIPVLYVSGNHEYYYRDYEKHSEELRARAASLGVNYLEKGTIEIDGVRFAGCTLWTDYNVKGNPTEAMETADVSLSDHYFIRSGDRAFSPLDALKLHQQSRAWLETLTDIDVVITHHCPSTLGIGKRDRIKGNEPSYVSNLDELITALHPTAWIFGHTHESVNIQHPCGTVLLSNPHGYPSESRAATGWRPDYMYDVVL